MCQQEAKEAAANERAKIIHSRKDLNANVRCTKVVMKAKSDYQTAIQEARNDQVQQTPRVGSCLFGGP